MFFFVLSGLFRKIEINYLADAGDFSFQFDEGNNAW